MPVKVTRPDGTDRIYTSATSFEVDGYGSFVFKDVNGNLVATRKRDSVEEIEVLENV